MPAAPDSPTTLPVDMLEEVAACRVEGSVVPDLEGPVPQSPRFTLEEPTAMPTRRTSQMNLPETTA